MVGLAGLIIFPFRAVGADSQLASVRLVSSTPDAVVLSFAMPDYTLRKTSLRGQDFIQVEASGLVSSAEPGAPQLPQTGVLVGLPPEGAPAVHILEDEQTRVSVSHPVYPVPVPVCVPDGRQSATDDYLPTSLTYEFAPNEAIYAGDAFHPSSVVDVIDMGWVRDYRVARVMFHPVRYNPARGELLVTRRLVVEIRFNRRGDGLSLAPSGANSAAFESLLRKAMLNYETARMWQAIRPGQMATAALNMPATQSGSYKVIVDAEGLYRLTYGDLLAAGLPVEDIDPRTFRLFERGQQVAIEVIGQQDGVFDSDDSILFYGRVPRSRYTDHNVYWLCFGDGVGLRMDTRDVSPDTQPAGVAWATARYEEDRFYDPLHPAADDDHWYAADLRSGTDHTITLALMPPASGVLTATLRVWMVGYTVSDLYDPDHRVIFAVNGDEIGDLGWNGVHPVTISMVLPHSILWTGDNSIVISAGVPNEGVWLDAVELEYALRRVTGDETIFGGQAGAHRYELEGFADSDIWLYDVTGPQQPVRLRAAPGSGTGDYVLRFSDAPTQPATYLALTEARIRQPVAVLADTPSDLSNSATRADYLIITHSEFVDAVQPLADYRQDQGLEVVVVDVQDVYDEFSGGLLDPEAIRALIAYAYAYWTPPSLTYVLLVGDGSYDFRNHLGYGSANYVPPYLGMVDPWGGETASDNRYAAIVGDDPLPDVLLGRLPVTNVSEVATVVQKVLNYEQAPYPGDWNAQHVFVAAEYDVVSFAGAANAIYDAFVRDPWVGQRIYVDDLTAETARQRTLDAWQQGALLVSFLGHGSWHQWAASRLPPVTSLLHIQQVPGLHNDRRWPVVLSMTCFTGYFHHPEYGTLDESLLCLAGGGAVATWSSSGLGVSTGHEHLHKGFYQAVFADGKTQLGPATLAAKLELYIQEPACDDLLDTYHLFGDPAMALNLTIRPWPYSTYLPMVKRVYPGG